MTDQVKRIICIEEEQEAEYARLDEISSKARECIKRHCIYTQQWVDLFRSPSLK